MKDFIRGASTMWPFWAFYAVLVVLWLVGGVGCVRVRASESPPVDCSLIRQYVQQLGEAMVLATARANGVEEKRIEHIRRTCMLQAEKKR